MIDGVRCPYCEKKVMESLHGVAKVRCRHCKRLSVIVGGDEECRQEALKLLHDARHPAAAEALERYADIAPVVAVASGPPTTIRREGGRYEYLWEFDPLDLS